MTAGAEVAGAGLVRRMSGVELTQLCGSTIASCGSLCRSTRKEVLSIDRRYHSFCAIISKFKRHHSLFGLVREHKPLQCSCCCWITTEISDRDAELGESIFCESTYAC